MEGDKQGDKYIFTYLETPPTIRVFYPLPTSVES